jgi:hypothetical protein
MNELKKQQPTSRGVGPYQKMNNFFSNHRSDKISYIIFLVDVPYYQKINKYCFEVHNPAMVLRYMFPTDFLVNGYSYQLPLHFYFLILQRSYTHFLHDECTSSVLSDQHVMTK